MTKIIKFALFLFLFSFIGCAISPIHKKPPTSAPKQDEELTHVNLEKVETLKEIEDSKTSESKIALKTADVLKVPEMVNVHKNHRENIQNFSLKYFKNHFDSWVKYLGHKDKERFLRHLENGKNAFPTVSRILRENGMPQELFLVGLIESGYYTRAKSHASAVGPWQFVKGTAVRYGLKVSRKVDERQNLEKATLAAVHYFKDLYNIFGSWELALCAYNAGEYRVINAIRKGNTRDYLSLVRKKLLPAETVMYVPKIEAARELIRNYQKHDLPFITDLFNQTNMETNFRVVETPILEIETAPILKTPRRRKVASHKAKTRVKKEVKRTALTTKVKKGDRLSIIAHTYGVDIKKIKKLNHIKKAKILAGQKLKIPVAKKSYTVRTGDNLNDIAKAHGVTVRAILRHNELDDSKVIFPKQKLVVPVAYGAL